MNYKKMLNLMRSKKVGRKEMAEFLEVTPYGFDRMISKNTLKVGTLERIAERLEVDPSFFFLPGDEVDELSDFPSGDLRSLYREMKKRNSDLEKIIELLEEKIGKK
jgi:transcriptional regulator with XRE-family HTH domain